VLAAELREILARPHLAAKLIEKGTTADAVTALYLEFARALSPLSVPRVVPDDPDDDHVIACAVAAKADVLSRATSICSSCTSIMACAS